MPICAGREWAETSLAGGDLVALGGVVREGLNHHLLIGEGGAGRQAGGAGGCG